MAALLQPTSRENVYGGNTVHQRSPRVKAVSRKNNTVKGKKHPATTIKSGIVSVVTFFTFFRVLQISFHSHNDIRSLFLSLSHTSSRIFSQYNAESTQRMDHSFDLTVIWHIPIGCFGLTLLRWFC